MGPKAGPFPTEFLARYDRHPWPGNVRELLDTVVRWQALGELGTSTALASVLQKSGGNVTKAAQASGIGRRDIHMLLAKIEGQGQERQERPKDDVEPS